MPTLAVTSTWVLDSSSGTASVASIRAAMTDTDYEIILVDDCSKDGTRDIYLVTRLYTEALSTMVVMRKSVAEGEALIRVKAERNSTGHNIPGFSPAQEEEKL